MGREGWFCMILVMQEAGLEAFPSVSPFFLE